MDLGIQPEVIQKINERYQAAQEAQLRQIKTIEDTAETRHCLRYMDRNTWSHMKPVQKTIMDRGKNYARQWIRIYKAMVKFTGDFNRMQVKRDQPFNLFTTALKLEEEAIKIRKQIKAFEKRRDQPDKYIKDPKTWFAEFNESPTSKEAFSYLPMIRGFQTCLNSFLRTVDEVASTIEDTKSVDPLAELDLNAIITDSSDVEAETEKIREEYTNDENYCTAALKQDAESWDDLAMKMSDLKISDVSKDQYQRYGPARLLDKTHGVNEERKEDSKRNALNYFINSSSLTEDQYQKILEHFGRKLVNSKDRQDAYALITDWGTDINQPTPGLDYFFSNVLNEGQVRDLGGQSRTELRDRFMRQLFPDAPVPPKSQPLTLAEDEDAFEVPLLNPVTDYALIVPPNIESLNNFEEAVKKYTEGPILDWYRYQFNITRAEIIRKYQGDPTVLSPIEYDRIRYMLKPTVTSAEILESFKTMENFLKTANPFIVLADKGVLASNADCDLAFQSSSRIRYQFALQRIEDRIALFGKFFNALGPVSLSDSEVNYWYFLGEKTQKLAFNQIQQLAAVLEVRTLIPGTLTPTTETPPFRLPEAVPSNFWSNNQVRMDFANKQQLDAKFRPFPLRRLKDAEVLFLTGETNSVNAKQERLANFLGEITVVITELSKQSDLRLLQLNVTTKDPLNQPGAKIVQLPDNSFAKKEGNLLVVSADGTIPIPVESIGVQVKDQIYWTPLHYPSPRARLPSGRLDYKTYLFPPSLPDFYANDILSFNMGVQGSKITARYDPRILATPNLFVFKGSNCARQKNYQEILTRRIMQNEWVQVSYVKDPVEHTYVGFIVQALSPRSYDIQKRNVAFTIGTEVIIFAQDVCSIRTMCTPDDDNIRRKLLAFALMISRYKRHTSYSPDMFSTPDIRLDVNAAPHKYVALQPADDKIRAAAMQVGFNIVSKKVYDALPNKKDVQYFTPNTPLLDDFLFAPVPTSFKQICDACPLLTSPLKSDDFSKLPRVLSLRELEIRVARQKETYLWQQKLNTDWSKTLVKYGQPNLTSTSPEYYGYPGNFQPVGTFGKGTNAEFWWVSQPTGSKDTDPNVWVPISWYTPIDVTWTRLAKTELFVRDCGGGGDCLFDSIAYAWNQFYSIPNLLDGQHIRYIAASQITESNYAAVKKEYLTGSSKIVKQFGDKEVFVPNTFFNKVSDAPISKQVKELQKLIRTPGHTFWGDDVMLKLLSESEFFEQNQVGIQVRDSKLQIIRRFYDQSRPFVLLLYYPEGHFTAMGVRLSITTDPLAIVTNNLVS